MILRWLAFSNRPISTEELAEVTGINAEKCSFDPDGVLPDSADVIMICSSLVTIIPASYSHHPQEMTASQIEGADDDDTFATTDTDEASLSSLAVSWEEEERLKLSPRSSYVRLAHYSVKEYLISERLQQSTSKANRFALPQMRSQEIIATSCIVYLLRFQPEDLGCDNREIESRFPLAWYAASFWFNHVQEVGAEENSMKMNDAIILLYCSNTVFESWIRLYDFDDMPIHFRPAFSRRLKFMPNPLYYAVLLGLSTVVQKLLEEPHVDIDAEGGRQGNALQAASSRSREKIAKLLIGKGADVNVCCGYHGSALIAASAEGSETIVKMLIDKGADVNFNNLKRPIQCVLDIGPGGTALQVAKFHGRKRIVEFLLSGGADDLPAGKGYLEDMKLALDFMRLPDSEQ